MIETDKNEIEGQAVRPDQGPEVAEPENQDGPELQPEPDMGAGMVMLTYDYGTETIRLSQDNLRLSAITACRDALNAFVEEATDQVKADVMRARITAEIHHAHESPSDSPLE